MISPAAAAGKPDLVVAAAVAAAETRQGERLAVTDKVVNKGGARSGRTTTVFYLSKDSKKGGDIKLSPGRSVASLRPGASSRGRTEVVVPAAAPVGAYFLVACADGGRRIAESNDANNCRVSRTTTVVAAPPTSHELIDEEVRAGTLDEETGLTYKVFSDFGDPRLPGRFVGEPNGLSGGALEEAAEQWSSLSIQAQTTLRPFLIPPYYAGSYADPSPPPARMAASQTSSTDLTPWCSGTVTLDTWNYVDTASGDVRIWWLAENTTDDVTAHHFADVLESKIMPALKSLMGRGPKPDSGGGCDGESPALDIALTDIKTATTYADGSCGSSGTSAHMIFPRSASSVGWAGLDPYLAHEVMHAVQYAMPLASLGCGQYKWVREMTAQWVQDYVTDPAYGIGVTPDDTEWQAAPIYLNTPETSLDVDQPPAFHSYGDYLLPFWAVRKSGPGIVADIWKNAATNTPIDAVDKALPGGFHDTWADFTLANWNHGPVHDYRDWDGLKATPKLTSDATVPLDGGLGANTEIPYLASKYYRFDFATGVKLIHFFNPYVGQDHVTMRAVITLADGTQKVEDWSDKQEITFCRDLPGENIREVVVIVSNRSTDKSKTITGEFDVYGEKQGCVCKAQPTRARNGGVGFRISADAAATCPGVTGTFTGTSTSTTNTPTLQANSSMTTTVNLVLKPVPDDPDTRYPEGQNSWIDAGTTVTVDGQSHSFSSDGVCSLTQESTESGGTVEHASANSNDDRKILYVKVSYSYEWTKTQTWGGDCAYLGSQTGEDTIDEDLSIDAEGDGSGSFTYHYEYHGGSGGGTYDNVQNGSFSVG